METLDPDLIEQIPARVAYHFKFLPLARTNGVLKVLVPDAEDLDLLDAIGRELGLRVEGVTESSEAIGDGLKRYYGLGAETIEGLIEQRDEDASPGHAGRAHRSSDLLDVAEDASIIKFVNQLLLEAFLDRATDIHIEPFEGQLRIRYRIDGVLHDVSVPDSIKRFQDAIASRIKVMANLDIAERRVPQDGRMRLRVGKEDLDLRVSILPIARGESVNLRLLQSSSILFGLEELGMDKSGRDLLERAMAQPHGIILLTGPTGSGKTTTLYSCLSRINEAERKIITVEDPVEYELSGVCQMQVHNKIGFTFSEGLRSMLRHDPDVMLVGEIRDAETASLAIRASLTGHLVFSTLHTNDAPGAVSRLVDLGAEPFLVASSLECVVAQRLVRKICDYCRVPATFPSIERAEFGLDALTWSQTEFFGGEGCDHCKGSGYRGRTVIHEGMTIDERLREKVAERVSANELRKLARAGGMVFLRENGWDKVTAGMTTPDEVLRVTAKMDL